MSIGSLFQMAAPEYRIVCLKTCALCLGIGVMVVNVVIQCKERFEVSGKVFVEEFVHEDVLVIFVDVIEVK